jgi:hypothetical protein
VPAPTFTIPPDSLEPVVVHADEIQPGDLLGDGSYLSRRFFGAKVEDVEVRPSGRNVSIRLNRSRGLLLPRGDILTVLRPSWEIV